MQIIIPMSGQGSRFVKAGYTVPKALIRVEGKPVIEYVADMFPDENDITFICNREHTEQTDMASVLKRVRPSGKIVVIDSHKKGPVFAIKQMYDDIEDDEDVFVSYCDYGQVWDYAQFKKDAARCRCAGAVPSYTGFHPHLLHRNLYAGVLADEQGMMTDIQEKHCFTENPEDSFHSGGAYYFNSGALMKKCFDELIDANIHLNGEHYVSLAYYLLKRDRLPVYIPTVKHFMQWGTPEDLEEYEAWSRLIHHDMGKEKAITDIPAAREPMVKVPYGEGTDEYEKCYHYWKEYLTHVWSI
jgi:NDP-sugar pyrophosphorylase family protein